MSLTYEEFKKLAAELTGVDLTAYKSQQMDRRLHSLMASWGVATYDDYLRVLQTDETRFNEFQKKLTINVSEFFRNPERFEEMEALVLPELFQVGRPLRIWSAGCSNGAEAYTVAMLIKESGYSYGARILATDINRESLRRAYLGVYSQNEVRSMPPPLMDKYFKADDRHYRLAESIKVMVDFKFHNLLHGHFDGQYDMILCRNVVIYLTEAAKDELYRKFCAVLRPGGFLMVGGTEPLLNFKEFGLENPLTAFYRKAAPAAPGKLGQAVR